MVNFTVPYAMDGTQIHGEMLRRQQQDVVGEGSGVVRAGDLKILPLDVPGQGVKIMPGHDLIQSRSPGRERETYGVQLNTAENYLGDTGQGITGTGSGVPDPATGILRRDMIIHEILNPVEDRHFTPQENWPAGATSKLSVVQNVALTAKTVDDVPELSEVTCYEMAAINWPVSTGTITEAMLEDLRRIQSPKTHRVWRPVNLTALQRLASASAYPAAGQTWPQEFTGEAGKIHIPKEATHVRIRMDWGSVRFLAAAKGLLWVQLGQNVHPEVKRTQPQSFDAAASSRESMFVVDTIAIPESMRGTDQWFFPRANLEAAIPTETQRPYVNTSSGIVLDVEFFQTAV